MLHQNPRQPIHQFQPAGFPFSGVSLFFFKVSGRYNRKMLGLEIMPEVTSPQPLRDEEMSGCCLGGTQSQISWPTLSAFLNVHAALVPASCLQTEDARGAVSKRTQDRARCSDPEKTTLESCCSDLSTGPNPQWLPHLGHVSWSTRPAWPQSPAGPSRIIG